MDRSGSEPIERACSYLLYDSHVYVCLLTILYTTMV